VTWLGETLARVVAIREALDIGDLEYAAELAHELEIDLARQEAAELEQAVALWAAKDAATRRGPT
jgi:hypothetical protein